MDRPKRPTLWGWPLPSPSTIVILTVVGSLLAYLFANSGLATLVASIGAAMVTVVIYKRDKAERNSGSR